MNREKIFEFYNSHRGEINGAVIGLLAALMFLYLGIIKTLVIALFMGIGYYFGKRISQDKDYLRNLLDRILPPGTYR